MNTVGEIDRRRPGRQVFVVAFRSVDKHLVLENVGSDRGEVFIVARKFSLPVDQLPEPRHLLIEVVNPCRAILIALVHPVRCNTLFGHVVHCLGADLHFYREIAGSAYRGV